LHKLAGPTKRSGKYEKHGEKQAKNPQVCPQVFKSASFPQAKWTHPHDSQTHCNYGPLVSYRQKASAKRFGKTLRHMSPKTHKIHPEVFRFILGHLCVSRKLTPQNDLSRKCSKFENTSDLNVSAKAENHPPTKL
jgi:hypothetical protein